MIGKGWLVIGGILLLMLLYSVASVSGLKGDVKELRGDVTDLKDQSATVSRATPEAIPSTAASPTENDLNTAKGRDAQRKQDLGNIAEAIVSFKEDKGYYPNGLNQLTPDLLDRLPADPSSPKYNYRYKHQGDNFSLTCILEQANDPDDKRGDGKADKVFTINQDYRAI